MKIILSILGLGSTLLVGCSAKPVLPVAEPNPPVAAVQQDINAHKDIAITWGGVILETNNADEQSKVLIISKRLESSTRPIEGDQTLGRFIAIIDGFLDPAIYSKDREMSVYGTIIGQEIRKVDDYEYTYPVVQVSEHKLWEVRVEYYNNGYYDNYWYGPYYRPYPYHHRSHNSGHKH
ncbi:hypothetical protein MNBD_GAMMA21-1510 [hydrothermal vent metagenome]|uniref:Starvation lipoprotein Slp paralog n=1 Tax=hydrothermal vent metagenome TaxID=652676 RepID=A0A3B0ZQB0_9ZZZZ